jgi:hypothetical protein
MSFKDKLTFLTVQDSSKLIKENRNEGKKIALWSKKGKTLLTVEDFGQLSENVYFDLLECPYDDFSSTIESKKRNRKAYERTKNSVDFCFSETNQTKVYSYLNLF